MSKVKVLFHICVVLALFQVACWAQTKAQTGGKTDTKPSGKVVKNSASTEGSGTVIINIQSFDVAATMFGYASMNFNGEAFKISPLSKSYKLSF